MVKMNDFISSNIPKLAAFYEKITEIPEYSESINTAEITPQIKNNALAFTYNHLIQNKSKVDKELTGDYEKEELKSRIDNIINIIGEPFAKAKPPNSGYSSQSNVSEEL